MNARRRGAVDTAEQDEKDTRLYYRWLLLSLFVEYARPASFLSFLQIPFLYSSIPLALLMFSSFSKAKLRPFAEIYADPLIKWLSVYFGMVAFSVTYAIVRQFAFEAFILVLGFYVYCILIARIVTTWDRLYGVIGMLLFSHLFLLAMNPNVVLEPETRNYILGATFLGDGNDFSLSLCMLFPLVMIVSQNVQRFWLKLLCGLSTVIVLMAIVASQSRGATLGMAAVLIFIWIKSRRKVASLFVMVIAGLCMLAYAPPEYFNRMNTISSYQEEGSAIGRLNAWSSGINMAIHNPLLGVGSGNFPIAYGSVYASAENHKEYKTAHSSYFLVLGELGFTGLAVLLTLVAGNMRQNVKLAKFIEVLGQGTPEEKQRMISKLNLLTAAILGFAVAGAFLSAAYYPHVFILLGVGLVMRTFLLRQAGLDPALLLPKKTTGRRRSPGGQVGKSEPGASPADAQPAQKRS